MVRWSLDCGRPVPTDDGPVACADPARPTVAKFVTEEGFLYLGRSCRLTLFAPRISWGFLAV